VAGSASSNGRSVSDLLTTVLGPSCHTVLNPLASNFERGVYNRFRLGMLQCGTEGLTV